jgi:hypothetical protein
MRMRMRTTQRSCQEIDVVVVRHHLVTACRAVLVLGAVCWGAARREAGLDSVLDKARTPMRCLKFGSARGTNSNAFVAQVHTAPAHCDVAIEPSALEVAYVVT